MSKLKVAVIGTGIMGTGVGLTLRSKGHEVTCWNRTKENAGELLRAGAIWKETPGLRSRARTSWCCWSGTREPCRP